MNFTPGGLAGGTRGPSEVDGREVRLKSTAAAAVAAASRGRLPRALTQRATKDDTRRAILIPITIPSPHV